MKYNLEDSSDNIVVISDIDAMYKKVVNEFGDEAIFINPYCIQCGAQIDVKIDNFTFVQASHLIKETAWVRLILSVIFVSFTWKTISQGNIQAFSAGEPEIGETIFKTQAVSIST